MSHEGACSGEGAWGERPHLNHEHVCLAEGMSPASRDEGLRIRDHQTQRQRRTKVAVAPKVSAHARPSRGDGWRRGRFLYLC